MGSRPSSQPLARWSRMAYPPTSAVHATDTEDRMPTDHLHAHADYRPNHHEQEAQKNGAA